MHISATHCLNVHITPAQQLEELAQTRPSDDRIGIGVRQLGRRQSGYANLVAERSELVAEQLGHTLDSADARRKDGREEEDLHVRNRKTIVAVASRLCVRYQAKPFAATGSGAKDEAIRRYG